MADQRAIIFHLLIITGPEKHISNRHVIAICVTLDLNLSGFQMGLKSVDSYCIKVCISEQARAAQLVACGLRDLSSNPCPGQISYGNLATHLCDGTTHRKCQIK